MTYHISDEEEVVTPLVRNKQSKLTAEEIELDNDYQDEEKDLIVKMPTTSKKKETGQEDEAKESLQAEKISFHLINGNKVVPQFSGMSPKNSAESDSDSDQSSKQATEEQDDESYITEESIIDIFVQRH